MAGKDRQYADLPGNKTGGRVLVAAGGATMSEDLMVKYGLKVRKSGPGDKASISDYSLTALREEAHKRRVDLSGLKTKEEILKAIEADPDPPEE